MVIRPKWNCHSPLLSPYKPLHVFEGLQFKRNCATTQLWLLMTCQHLHNASWYLLSWHITLFFAVKYQEILLLNFPDQMWHVIVITISRILKSIITLWNGATNWSKLRFSLLKQKYLSVFVGLSIGLCLSVCLSIKLSQAKRSGKTNFLSCNTCLACCMFFKSLYKFPWW